MPHHCLTAATRYRIQRQDDLTSVGNSEQWAGRAADLCGQVRNRLGPSEFTEWESGLPWVSWWRRWMDARDKLAELKQTPSASDAGGPEKERIRG